VNFGKFILVLSIGTALVGCDALRRGGTGPDEFAVVKRAPLSLPPDYGLRPPRPGAMRPNETSPRDDAQSKLLRNLSDQSRRSTAKENKNNRKFTSGESALLKRAEALDVDPSIRHVVERESGRIKEDDSLVESLVFWRDKTKPKTLVEPNEESKRLRDNAALGKSPTEGTTPVIKKK
jgi:hypothetical protein